MAGATAIGWASLAMVGISVILIMHATMIPNANTVALGSLGHVAGMASAVVGTVSMAGGALLGTIIDRSLGETITPFVLGFVVYGLIAAGWVAWAERGAAGGRAPAQPVDEFDSIAPDRR